MFSYVKLIILAVCFHVVVLQWSAADHRPLVAIGSLTISPQDSESVILAGYNAIQSIRPFVQLGMQYLNDTYGHIFRFHHAYLIDPKRADPNLLIDDAENLVAKFYYNNRRAANALALISPCESPTWAGNACVQPEPTLCVFSALIIFINDPTWCEHFSQTIWSFNWLATFLSCLSLRRYKFLVLDVNPFRRLRKNREATCFS